MCDKDNIEGEGKAVCDKENRETQGEGERVCDKHNIERERGRWSV